MSLLAPVYLLKTYVVRTSCGYKSKACLFCMTCKQALKVAPKVEDSSLSPRCSPKPLPFPPRSCRGAGRHVHALLQKQISESALEKKKSLCWFYFSWLIYLTRTHFVHPFWNFRIFFFFFLSPKVCLKKLKKIKERACMLLPVWCFLNQGSAFLFSDPEITLVVE